MRSIHSVCIAIAAATMLSAFAPTAAVADDWPSARNFTGLWEAIDPPDGSLSQRSITCNRRGECSVLGSDSFWSFCGDDRGVLSGTGEVRGGRLIVPDFILRCFDDMGEVDDSISVETRFVYDRFNRTLDEEHPSALIPTITFHRTSR